MVECNQCKKEKGKLTKEGTCKYCFLKNHKQWPIKTDYPEVVKEETKPEEEEQNE